MSLLSTGSLPLALAWACVALLPEVVAGEKQTSFARRQLEQMCEDRPDMAGVLEATDPVYRWIESCMDIGNVKRRIYWIAVEPQHDCEAQHSAAWLTLPAQLRITSDERLTPEDRWLLVIFELHNIDNTEDFQKLRYSLSHGVITADQYATQALLLELAAEVRTKKFLQRYVAPSHRLTRSTFYKHYMMLPDGAPQKLLPAERRRCQRNLKYFHDWAERELQYRSMLSSK